MLVPDDLVLEPVGVRGVERVVVVASVFLIALTANASVPGLVVAPIIPVAPPRVPVRGASHEPRAPVAFKHRRTVRAAARFAVIVVAVFIVLVAAIAATDAQVVSRSLLLFRVLCHHHLCVVVALACCYHQWARDRLPPLVVCLDAIVQCQIPSRSQAG